MDIRNTKPAEHTTSADKINRNLLDSKSKYETITYYCNGKRICGNSNAALTFSTCLIVIPTILYYIFTAPNFLYSSEIIIFYILTVVSFIIDLLTLYDVSSTSPGYLPKGEMTQEEFLNRQETKVVKNNEIELKYCESCKIIRELRSFHCRICGHCIEKHDHHCPWVGNCIGKNNISKFFYFLIFTLVHAILIFSTGLYFILTRKEQMDILNKTYAWIISIVIVAFSGSIIIIMIVGVLFQTYLISNNLTTNEVIRSKLPKDLFDEGCEKNCKEVFCL